jgi:hypothetical protein
MSTIGLYSTLYTRLAECAELLDKTLIQLKQQQQPAISDQQRQLGQLLISLTQSPRGLDAQLLALHSCGMLSANNQRKFSYDLS